MWTIYLYGYIHKKLTAMPSSLHVINKSHIAATASVLDLTLSLSACGIEQVSDICRDTATNVDFGASDVAMTDEARSFGSESVVVSQNKHNFS